MSITIWSHSFSKSIYNRSIQQTLMTSVCTLSRVLSYIADVKVSGLVHDGGILPQKRFEEGELQSLDFLSNRKTRSPQRLYLIFVHESNYEL